MGSSAVPSNHFVFFYIFSPLPVHHSSSFSYLLSSPPSALSPRHHPALIHSSRLSSFFHRPPFHFLIQSLVQALAKLPIIIRPHSSNVIQTIDGGLDTDHPWRSAGRTCWRDGRSGVRRAEGDRPSVRGWRAGRGSRRQGRRARVCRRAGRRAGPGPGGRCGREAIPA